MREARPKFFPLVYFDLKPEHVTLLRRMYVEWQDMEYGAPAINPKRPYGNSSVEADICEILGWISDPDEEEPTTEQREAAAQLHRETETALQVVLATGQMVPGRYAMEKYHATSWRAEPENG